MKMLQSIISSLFLIFIAAVFPANGNKVTDGAGKITTQVPHGNFDAIHKKEVEKMSLSTKNHVDDKPKVMKKIVLESMVKKDVDNKRGKMKKPTKLQRKLQNESSRKLARLLGCNSIAKKNFLKSLKNQKAMRRQFCYENCRKPAASAKKLIHNRDQQQKHKMPHRIGAHRQRRAIIECNQCNNEFDDNEFDACPNCDPDANNIGGDVTSDDDENQREVDGTRIEKVDNDFDALSNDSGEDDVQSDSSAGSDAGSDDEDVESEHSSVENDTDSDSDSDW